MKRTGLILGLSLIVSVTMFGQKKAVAEALKFAKGTNPNFAEARTKIKGALENAETKDDAKTWFTAGQIESLQFDAENLKQILGQAPNEAVMYTALGNVWQYFRKAYELDQLPDAKGKVKPKYVKDMKSILNANLPYYLNGGGYFFDQKDYNKAFDFFDQYVVIKDSKLMKEGEKVNPSEIVDSTYIYSIYYAGIASSYINDKDKAIAAMTRAIQQDFKKNDMLQFLAEEYKIAADTANWEKILNEGLSIYPKEPYFLLNLINIYINTGNNDKAISYIKTALQNDPDNAELYDVAGKIFETNYKDFAQAEEYFKKALELDSENPDIQSNLGRIYFNQAVTQLENANEISDVKKYNEEKEKAKALFKQALPYFEKAYKLKPEAMDNKIALRSIYYNLDMSDKFEEMEKVLNQ